MTIRLMGRLAVEVDGVAADDAGLGQLGRLALAYLVLERHRPVSRDELADVLWGEALPATWEAALRGVVSRVRAALAAGGVGVGSRLGCYQLDVPAGIGFEVDVEGAAASVESAERAAGGWCLSRSAPGAEAADLPLTTSLAVRPNRQPGGRPPSEGSTTSLPGGGPEEALALANGAADVTGGRFLPGASGDWVERRQAALGALQVRALEAVAEAAGACGDHGRAVAAAGEAVRLAPLRESAHQRLMAAHDRAGDRAGALAAYARCRTALAEELGVSPSAETDRLYVRLLGDEPAAAGPAAADRPANLPAGRTTFVGRAGQIDELHDLLDGGRGRLLTLTGPGGVGKSRLALQLAERSASGYPDGTWFVELAGLNDDALVAPQVLSVLGVPEPAGGQVTEAIAAHVANRSVLLVLDNCEHLVAACAALADALLAAAPRLRIVATSREPLGVPGETMWPVPPLSGAEAEQLFRDRVAAAAPLVDLSVSKAAREVADICARLDGIPLAIELAAARARLLSLAEIARRLDDRLRVLVAGPRAAPGRHQTLRATIDWSYDALPADEQALYAGLSVFAGGFGLDAAERVSGAPVETLGALVDKSLVAVEREGSNVRYRVLEILRQYGAERLDESGRADVVRDRHLDWAVDLAEAAEADLEGPAQGERLAALDREHDNLRLALDWAAARGRVDDGLRLASALMRFWEVRGYLGQGRSRLVALAGRPEGSADLRAGSLNAAAVLAQRQNDTAAARTLYQESLVIRRALGDRLGVATALHGLANLAAGDGDLVTARALYEENLAIARELGHARMEAASLMNLGVVSQYSFMHGHRTMDDAGPEARSYYQEALDRYRELGDRFNEALALENLGALERFLTGPDLARTYHEQCIAARRELGDKLGIAASARYLVSLALQRGETATARHLAEERLAIERELGNFAQTAEVLVDLGVIAGADGDLLRARDLLEESRSIYVRFGDRKGEARVSGNLADVERRLGNLDECERLLALYRDVAVQTDNRHGLAWCCIRDADLARSRHDAAKAVRLARTALADAEEHAIVGVEACALDLLAWAELERGDAGAAARLLGAAEALRGSSPGARSPEREADTARARAVLGDAQFEAAVAEGQALSAEERRALARS